LDLVVATLARLPGRQAETAAKWLALGPPPPNTRGLVQGVLFLLERVNVMRMDKSNVQVRALSVRVQEDGIEYERDKFRDKVRAKTVVPFHTKNWITIAAADVREPHLSTAVRVALHTRAMISLLADVGLPIPETLDLDRFAIQDMRREFDFLVRAKTLVALLGMERLPGSLAPKTVPEMTQQKAEARERVVSAISILEFSSDLDMSDFAIPPAYARMVANELLLDEEGPLRSLMRLQVERALTLRTVSTTPFAQRLNALVAQFHTVARLNRLVHGAFYDAIIDNVDLDVDAFFSA
jgi:hypothetical protein